MKNTTFAFLGALLMVGAMFIAGCTDPCKDVNCNSGTCVDGNCVCNTGYEGSDCATAFNAKFVGSFAVVEACSTGNFTYNLTIAASSTDADKAIITGLYGTSLTATAHIHEGGLEFDIPTAAFGSSTISGTGTSNADGSSISLSYTINDGTNNDPCTATLTKQ